MQRFLQAAAAEWSLRGQHLVKKAIRAIATFLLNSDTTAADLGGGCRKCDGNLCVGRFRFYHRLLLRPQIGLLIRIRNRAWRRLDNGCLRLIHGPDDEGMCFFGKGRFLVFRFQTCEVDPQGFRELREPLKIFRGRAGFTKLSPECHFGSYEYKQLRISRRS